ncbi:serine hydrolase [Maricaulis salignorans]|uniref:serine hydrolase n=1 Tax=Maricaulis salignorans TaxID=144026 RepID=UPI003A90173F
MIRTAIVTLGLLAGLNAPAMAQTLMSEDFQDGNAEGWRGDAGRGEIRITEYAGNFSLRLQRNAWVAAAVQIPAGQAIRISADFAAEGLEGDDACQLETSFDGQDWTGIGRIEDGQDDGVTLTSVGGDLPAAGMERAMLVRLRAAGNAANDTCWVDNIRVTGQTPLAALTPVLTAQTLFAVAPLSGSYSTSAFAAPDDAASSSASLNGRLVLATAHRADRFALLLDEFDAASRADRLDELPAFAIDLLSDGQDLIPVQRGPQQGDHPEWEWIFQPGRIWDGGDGEGWMRAALPVALQERNANCVQNGLMSFLYRESGEISQAVVQFGAQTCAYLQFDLLARLPVSFEPGEATAVVAGAVRQAWRSERAARLPRSPLGDLALAHPQVDLAEIGSPLEVTPENMTAFALVADGRFFAGDCPTRQGPDPYCDVTPLPSYSVAKSVVGGIGLMRLEQLYPGARQALIADYVPQCTAARWGDVTFEQALDMATGNYTSDVYDLDEASAPTWDFLTVETHAEKVERACAMHPRQAEPGSTWVYHTTDTYLLGTAMQAYLRQQSGQADADFYDTLLVPIWQALSLSPLAMQTRRTRDAEAQAFTGWGLTLSADDMARMALFLQADGVIDGEAWLDQGLLAAALQRNPDDRGLPAIEDNLRYRAGFWAYNAGHYLGCDHDVWIPTMSGYGGISVTLIPNGHVYLYASDGREFSWRRAVAQSFAIQPFCEAVP